MAIHYTYERDCVLASAWRRVAIPEDWVQKGSLELHEVQQLLREDGVSLEDVLMTCYFDECAKAYIRFTNPISVSSDPGFVLTLTLRKEKSAKIRELMAQITHLSNQVADLSQRLELLEQQKIPDGGQLPPSTDEIDIAVLLAAPLVKIEGKKRSGLYNSNLDFESDKRRLINYLRNNDVRAALRFEAATVTSLGKLLQAKPSVLQIECHGCFKNDIGPFFLAFESSRNMGELFELDKDALRSALQDAMHGNTANLIVLVNACYSETVANVFLEAGVRCVVAVHQQTRILDVAVKEFTHEFYRQLFSRNQSIRDAFTLACQAVKREQATLLTCCCAHEHTTACEWSKKATTNAGSMELHNEHNTPLCSCRTAKVNNFHKKDCDWALNFLDTYAPKRVLTDEETKNGFVLCCCRPEIPHGESMKFAFYSDKEFENFHIASKDHSEVKHSTPDVPMPPAASTRTFGQHDKIQELVSALGKNSSETHFINVIGESGVGKTVIVKRAAYYAFERHAFPQGVIYIDMTGRTSISYIFREVENVFKTSGIKTKQEFCQFLRDLSILLVIDGTDDILRQERETFPQSLNFIVENAYSPKILVVSRERVNIEGTTIRVNPLSPHRAAELLIALTVDSIPASDRRNWAKFGQHKLFQLIGTTPHAIKLAASSINKPGDLDKLVQSHEQGRRAQTQDMVAYQMAFDFLAANPHRGSLFLLLSFFPSGLHRNDIVQLCERLGIEHEETLREFEDANTSGELSKRFIEEANGWFTAHPGFSQYLTKRESRDIHDFISEIARYLAELSRYLVRLMAGTSPYIDLSNLKLFNAVVDDGLWRSPNEVEVTISIPAEIQPQKYYERHERNFMHFLNSDTLEILSGNEANHRFKTLIGELALCTATCALLLWSRDQALETLVVGLKACEILNIRKSFCTLLIMEASLVESKNLGASSVLTAIQGFEDIDSSDGLFEAYLFQLLSKERFPANELKSTLAMLKEQLAKSQFPVLARARMELAVAEMKIQAEQSKPQILSQLNRALSVFDSLKRDHWAVRTVIAKVDYYIFEKKLKDAKRLCDEAFSRCQGIKSRTLEKILKEKQVLINRELQKHSQNVASFSFLKAYPLVKMSGHEFERAGPIARVFNTFRASILETLTAAKKQVYVKFDHCTVENLAEVLKTGCSVLHLSSTEPVKSGFSFENADGSAHIVSLPELSSRLSPDSWQSLKVLILEAPYAKEMATSMHTKLGIPHVIGFSAKDFPTTADTFPLIDIIDSVVARFCVEFYSVLLKCESVKSAFLAGSKAFEEDLNRLSDQINGFFVESEAKSTLEKLQQGAYLIDPDSEIHTHRLFVSSYAQKQFLPEIVIETGDMRDLSKPRAPSNLQKELGAHVGRQLAMYKAIKMLEDGKCVHVTGVRGIGKSRFIKDLGYQFLLRNGFLDGIYYLSLRGKAQLDEELRALELIQSSDQLTSLEKKKILLLMDDCDTLMIKEQQFLYLLRFLAAKCELGVVFSSKINFLHTSTSDFIAKVDLAPFSAEEAAIYCYSLRPDLKHFDVDPFSTKVSLIESLAITQALAQPGLTPKAVSEMAKNSLTDSNLLNVEETKQTLEPHMSLKYSSSVSLGSGELRSPRVGLDLNKSDRGMEVPLLQQLERPRSSAFFPPILPVQERQDSEDPS